MDIYVVQAGDDVDSIAAKYQIPISTLVYDNQIEPPYRLAVGQALFISKGENGSQRRPLYISGYAFPFIEPTVLAETVQWITGLYVFSYGFTEDGQLVLPAVDDTWMIPVIWQGGARPVLTLTPLGADGFFSTDLITALFKNPQAQERLIQELKEVMHTKSYGGLDIDFEYIAADDRLRYVDFVRKVTESMNASGYLVSVALAPKTSADQEGILYEGIDYELLGEIANRVMLMTYEWGYTYGPPMAVSPIDKVKTVVEYAVSVIPKEKISMGIPNYGYDWALPFERGVTRARSISNLEAIQIAIEHGAEIQFDETAQTPYFHYWQSGIEHEVWFEDVRSLKAKFDLINEFNLSGAGYWQFMNYFRVNWLLMDTMFYSI